MVIEEFKKRQIHLGNGYSEIDDMVYLSIRRSIRELFVPVWGNHSGLKGDD
jgi:hypothetical protein